MTMHEKCPYSELFWSVFFCVWSECEEIFRISPYSVIMWENTDQNNSEYGHFLRSVMQHLVENNFGICQLTEVLKIYCLMDFYRSCFPAMVLFKYFVDFFDFFCFCFMSEKYYLSKLMLLCFRCQKISFLCKQNFFMDEKHKQ